MRVSLIRCTVWSLYSVDSTLEGQAKAPQCIMQCTPPQLAHTGLQAELEEPWPRRTLPGVFGQSLGNTQHPQLASSLSPEAASLPSVLLSSRSTSRTGGSSRVHAGHTDVSPISYTLTNKPLKTKYDRAAARLHASSGSALARSNRKVRIFRLTDVQLQSSRINAFNGKNCT